jgi:uncharacterized delta-60 repeat protein
MTLTGIRAVGVRACGWLIAALAAGTTLIGSLTMSPAALAAPGSPDPTFGTNGVTVAALGPFVGAAAAVVQPDGKIVTVGEAELGITTYMVSARFNADGTLDAGFGFAGWVVVDLGGGSGGNAIALQADGKIVLAGTGYGGSSTLDFAAARLMPNGRLDSTFGNGGVATIAIGSYAIANAVTIDSLGRIDLGGAATVGQNKFAVARLLANGKLDTSFGTGGITTFSNPGAAWGMVQQSDGKLVLAGQASLGPIQEYMAARVTASGAPDSSFGFGGTVLIPIGQSATGDAIAIQPDGKLLISGSAFTNTGVAATVRLLPSGFLDLSFGLAGISLVPLFQAVNAITVDRGGKIVLAATGATAVRLMANGFPDATFGNGGVATVRVGTNTAANGVAIAPGTGAVVLSGVTTLYGHTVLAVIRLTGG